ncbi:hypothetical protein AB0L14_34895 [Streptomyces sp. NPDC052727]|uniref:hypothetical protein n=1 Tax=Streptomyces sp. NPDC052727 TaxID=3154854 RepID=UPI003438639D
MGLGQAPRADRGAGGGPSPGSRDSVSTEAAGLADRAGLVVDGPEGVVGLLRALAVQLGREPGTEG